MASKKYAHITNHCVACGTCVSACPLDAINIHKGLLAKVNNAKCVGCGKCASICPAGIIEIRMREVVLDEAKPSETLV